jgi:hypothetical protein
MSDTDVLIQAGPEVLQGNAALWLGPHWQPPNDENLARLLAVSWLAIWSESRDASLASRLKEAWSRDPHLNRRVIAEVSGRIADTLGSYFALPEVCPVFYLNGRERSWEALPAREQRRARDEQVDAVTKLRSALLLMVGFSTASEVLGVIRDEMPAGIPLRAMVLGLPSPEQQVLTDFLASVGYSERSPILIFNRTIAELLQDVAGLFSSRPVHTPAVRVGKINVDLTPVLEREHPIDQDFFVLTTDALRPPDESEDSARIVEDLVAARTLPWRAFAHNLQWRRDSAFFSETLTLLHDVIPTSGQGVMCVDVPAEPGAGLTTFLHELGFRLAQLGYPTLVAKPNVARFDYDLLRTFLEHLSGFHVEMSPAVLIFDAVGPGFDRAAGITELLSRLAKDGRHVLALRGVSLKTGDEPGEIFRSANALFGRAREKLRERWTRPLRASLSRSEQVLLVDWAIKYWKVPRSTLTRAIETWGADWGPDSAPPPLLVCLYFLLRDQLTSAANIGHHLVSRLKPLLTSTESVESILTSSPRAFTPLSTDELSTAVGKLQRYFKSEAFASASVRDAASGPTREGAATLCIALSVFGALRIAAPRSVLSLVTGLNSTALSAALLKLEQSDVIEMSVNADVDPAYSLLARPAYYTDVDIIGLRHPGFGRLILDWALLSPRPYDGNLLDCPLLDAVTTECYARQIPKYPIRLLKPILERLTPTQTSVAFAEILCARFLRLQRVRGSDYHQWQWSEPDTLLEVLAAVPEAVARQSSVILHTRGMTRYKSCRVSLALEECRKRYEAAAEDFTLAVERAREISDGERPGFVITSHGLLYQGWARQEDERGSAKKGAELRDTARQYLREGLRLSGDRENPYAAFGLAGLLIEECERARESSANDEQFSSNLTEALDLLQFEPDESFEVEWIELRQRALALLQAVEVSGVIDRLKSAGDEAGVALEALQILSGNVPSEQPGPNDIDDIRRAWTSLQVQNMKKKSTLASLLRYAIFSSLPERATDPAFAKRFELVQELEGSRYLERPIWLFDYGLLALQIGRLKVSLDAFRRLRRGGRFLEVPLERSGVLVNPDRPTEPRAVRFRVVRTDEDKGWARVLDVEGFTEPVPFASRLFRVVGSPTTVGATFTGRLRIRPAGPTAEPMRN